MLHKAAKRHLKFSSVMLSCGLVGSFFSLMGCYGPSGDSLSASSAMKKLVKELHKNGIEVFYISLSYFVTDP